MENEKVMKNDVSDFIEVELKTPEDFLKVKETLTRIGIPSKTNRTLYQSCHILHKQGRYFILHFKELFRLDGKVSTLSEADIQRKNTIAKLLHEWGLIKIIYPLEFKEEDFMPVYQIKIVNFRDKENWSLIPKYNIGKKF